MDNSQIIIYQTENGQTKIDVKLENETVWLTQKVNGRVVSNNSSKYYYSSKKYF